MNKFISLTVQLFGYISTLSETCLFYVIFLKAYANTDKQILLDINGAGEAHLELIMFPIIICFSILGLRYLLKDNDLNIKMRVKNERKT